MTTVDYKHIIVAYRHIKGEERLLQRTRQKGEESVNRNEIEETMRLINEKIQKKCKQEGNSSQEIYLLSLALNEMNQLLQEIVK